MLELAEIKALSGLSTGRSCVMFIEGFPLEMTARWSNFSNCSEDVERYNQQWEMLVEMYFKNEGDCVSMPSWKTSEWIVEGFLNIFNGKLDKKHKEAIVKQLDAMRELMPSCKPFVV